MRVDLWRGGTRPWIVGVFIRTMRLFTGMVSWPMLTMSYRFDLMVPGLRTYFLRGGVPGPWTQGEMEMFASFVSTLNECHF